MKSQTRLVATAIALLFVFALPADAGVVDITYTGTVLDGYDITGVFGVPGADLTGLSFTTIYRLDTSVPAVFSETPDQSKSFAGGSGYGVPTPLRAALIINGEKHIISGTYFSADSRGIVPDGGGIEDGVTSQDTQGAYYDTLYNNILSFTSSFIPGVDLADLTTPFTYDVQEGDLGVGSFQYYLYDQFSNQLAYTQGNLNTESVTVGPATTDLPEPATMWLFGVGIVGVVVGRRREKAQI